MSPEIISNLIHKIFVCTKKYSYYTYGIRKIYTAEEIEKAKQSPSFEREYNPKYLGKIGNVFHIKDIEIAIKKDRKYNPDIIIPFTSTSMDIDLVWGSSAFGTVVTQ